jgi:hypothetical protein
MLAQTDFDCAIIRKPLATFKVSDSRRRTAEHYKSQTSSVGRSRLLGLLLYETGRGKWVNELKDYLKLWGSGLPERKSIILATPITVLGVRNRQLGPRGEFAKVQMTLNPAPSLEVIDHVAERTELERLGVGWPDAVVFGLLDVLMLAEPGPLHKVSVVLELVWYHDVDSSLIAFRHAGRDAGRKVLEDLVQGHLWSFEY